MGWIPPIASVARLTRLLTLLLVLIGAAPASAQTPPFDQNADLLDRPVSEVRLEGLKRVTETTVRNNIRTAVGDPFDPSVIKGDVARLNRLGQFRFVEADAQLQNDGSVVVLFRFVEQPIITEINVVGNRLISNEDLLAAVTLAPGGPRDDFLIQNARRSMEEMYRKRGHYLTTVMVDETELERAGLLIFKVNEGPRVKVRAVEFRGNEAFTSDQLFHEVKTRPAIFLLRKGELDEEQLIDDVAALDRFYKDRGYLDVRVDREIELSPDGEEAKVVFLVAEGARYTLRSVKTTDIDGGPLTVFAPEQIGAMMELKPGDAFSRDLMRKSVQAIQDAYGLMGYMLSEEDRRAFRLEDWSVFVRTVVERVPDAAQVDLVLEIAEGEPQRVGEVQIQGNFLTRDRVIRRELGLGGRGLTPGRPFDTRQIAESERRLERTRLFNQARITVQREDPDDPGYRDVLVEIKERNTGSVNFGVAVGSDAGLFGEFSITQNNFDVTDTPESLDELLSGRAFRGAGQRFNITLRPGTEIFQFITSLTEPHLLDSEYSLSTSAQFFNRIYTRYDEQRFGGSVGIGRAFGEVWTVNVRARGERVELNNIDPFAPTEIFLDAGPDLLTSLGFSVTRTTITQVLRPGSGSRFEIGFDQFGALGGDISFSRASAEYTVYFTIDEDFLGRLTTLRINSRVGHIFGGRAPTYERFYMGGRSFRGFEFRTISPRGIRADTLAPSNDPVGGTWQFFLGSQYEMPLLGDALSGVIFVDSGTVTNDVGLDDYRVSAGVGIRLHIPQFGPTPLAFDFGVPLVKQSGDDDQVFSFSAELPF